MGIVSFNIVVRFRCLLRLSLCVKVTYKSLQLKAARFIWVPCLFIIQTDWSATSLFSNPYLSLFEEKKQGNVLKTGFAQISLAAQEI